MKLYTKRGDDGQTDLFGGKRVGKDDLRVRAYGDVDELNGAIGLAICACQDAALADLLTGIQSTLFELGSDLATPRPPQADLDKAMIPRICPQQAQQLEQHIDAIDAHLPTMRHFVLPGGCELAARLHLARSICRRAERLCVQLDRTEPIGPAVIIYLNRLSDLLFAMARRANQLAGIEDVPWVPRAPASP